MAIANTYVDVHVLHSVPPSNPNRDDNGTPKHAQYGGVRRARVSSQAWKRATRMAMANDGAEPESARSTRTKRIGALVATRLAEVAGIGMEDATRITNALLATLHISPGRRSSETAYLLYFGRSQVDRIVALVAERVAELALLDDAALAAAVAPMDVRERLGSGHPVDVALFGRMIAQVPQLNIDAAVQVAHALSTHRVEVEFDFYTAIDDEKPMTGASGAEMMDAVEFHSALYYRFASVGMNQLIDNLDGNSLVAVQAVQRFLPAFVKSLPTGRQNSFAHHTPPFLASIAVRECPVNLVSGFEQPVQSGDGLALESAVRLAAAYKEADEVWGYPTIGVNSTYPAAHAAQLSAALGEPLSFSDVVSSVVGSLADRQWKRDA
ncbi:type I-E CRISPR-associated protein Cas7/Cse4/CasC [Nocardia brasiliensis]|uniref:type I-E CRISPR-associated protein Cas7/Cse4/CasC n=1 Tax=Nocardia brasiliensis TaxID=37326 RepID=UPI0024569232|nr:type I-E CRISPR-associated protein Cas7/Cse4/CasC [Nocardia brasiliensis]